MTYFLIIVLLIISYLLGSIPSGYILVKYIKKIDIRNEGSKNTGATNTTRILGARFGLIALIFDCIKGIIIMSILIIFNLTNLYIFKNVNILPLYGLTAVFGHVFSIFLDFKGGKAVATSFGILMFLTPIIGLIAALVFIIIVLTTKYVSLASVIGSSLAGIMVLLSSIFKLKFLNVMATPSLGLIPLSYGITVFILATIIVIRHSSNIKRLINGNENKFSLKKKD